MLSLDRVARAGVHSKIAFISAILDRHIIQKFEMDVFTPKLSQNFITLPGESFD